MKERIHTTGGVYDLLAEIERQSQRLEVLADEQTKKFQAFHVEGNMKNKTDRSFLYCSYRTREDSIYLEWNYNYWIKGSNKRYSKYIKKPKDKHSYTLAKLLKHSAPWEYEMVKKTEKCLSLLRWQNAALSKARHALRETLKACLEYDALLGDSLEG